MDINAAHALLSRNGRSRSLELPSPRPVESLQPRSIAVKDAMSRCDAAHPVTVCHTETAIVAGKGNSVMPKSYSVQSVGIALVVAAAVAWSTAPVFVRLLAFDSWTIVFWRSVF